MNGFVIYSQPRENRFVDPVREGVDLCLRTHTEPLPGAPTWHLRHALDARQAVAVPFTPSLVSETTWQR